MSLRVILPQIIQPFRARHTEQPVEPISLGPLDVLHIMDLVERDSRRSKAVFAPGAIGEGAHVLAPEPGFRY